MSRLAFIALLVGLAAANMPSKDYPSSSITLPNVIGKPLPIEIPSFETEVAPEEEGACDDGETIEGPVVILPKPQPDIGFIPGDLVKPVPKPEEPSVNPGDLVKPVPKPDEPAINPGDLLKPVPKPDEDELPCVVEETPIVGVQPPTLEVEQPTVGVKPPTLEVDVPTVGVQPPTIELPIVKPPPTIELPIIKPPPIAVEPPTIDPDYVPENIWITS